MARERIQSTVRGGAAASLQRAGDLGAIALPGPSGACGRLRCMSGILHNDRFPRSNGYNPEWIMEDPMGAHPLWLTEWLAGYIDLQPDMRVLDLGCGKAKSSVFLAREFGAEVWAVDLWTGADENLLRIEDAGVSDRVVPIHADAPPVALRRGVLRCGAVYRFLQLLRDRRPVPELLGPLRASGQGSLLSSRPV